MEYATGAVRLVYRGMLRYAQLGTVHSAWPDMIGKISMNRVKTTLLRFLIMALVFPLASCALFRGEDDTMHHAREGDIEGEANGGPGRDDLEQRLTRIVEQRISATQSERETNRNTLQRRRPYYYKEYEVYHQGAEDMRIEIREVDALSTPFRAEVSLAKQRFATRLHRERDAAATDNDFLRDTGKEQLTYELRNGRWMKVGSLFLSERTERNEGGEWVPVEERVERTVKTEEEAAEGWFARAWSKIVSW